MYVYEASRFRHFMVMAPADVAKPANYNPKALQLDTEGNVNVHTGPVVTSFFGMLRRVHRIEVSVDCPNTPLFASIYGAVQGWAGLYKGLSKSALVFHFHRKFTGTQCQLLLLRSL